MAENVFQMLQQAWSVAKTSDANLYGVEIAIVTNVQDPDKQGKVKVCFPRLPGKPESGWARVAQPAAGDGRGFYWLPQVNDEVLVAFERGQANHPYVIGSVWNGKDKPMKDGYTDENSTVMVQTTSGHQVILYDKDGEEKIVIADKSGKRSVTWDVKGKKFLIEAKEGDVEFHAKKKIVIQCEDLEIKTKKTGKLDIGSTFDLKVAQKAGFKAGPQMNMKADKVNLNPPSLDLAALVAAALAAAARAAAAAAGANEAQQNAAAAAAAAAANAVLGGGGGGDLSKDVVEKAEQAAKDAAKDAAAKAGQGGVQGTDWTKDKDGGQKGSSTDGSKPGDKAGSDAAGGGTDAGKSASGAKDTPPGPNDIAVTLDDKDGNPVGGVKWQVTLPDGSTKTGTTGDDGKISITGLSASGSYKLLLPDIDKTAPAGGGGSTPAGGDGGTAPASGDGSAQPAPAGAQQPADQTTPQASPDDAVELNPWVLKVIQQLGTGGGYAWPHAEEGTCGVTEDLMYQGTCIAKAASTRETYCCGITYEVMVKAYQLYCQEKGIPFKIGNLSVRDMLNVRSDWFIASSGLKGPVDGLVPRGLGQEITDPSQAKPGDFVQLWRGAPPSSGHSVIFMGLQGGKLHYWSTQNSTGGRGENTESFHTLYIARAFTPKGGGGGGS